MGPTPIANPGCLVRAAPLLPHRLVTGATRPSPAPGPPLRNRIVGSALVSPGELVPNPRNWRRHPRRQRSALSGAIAEIGLVAGVTVNRTTGHLLDGHLRVELALERGEPFVPVSFVELTPEEERLALVTFDPIGAMADGDAAILAGLLANLTPDDAGLTAMLDELARDHGLPRPGQTDPDEIPPLPGDDRQSSVLHYPRPAASRDHPTAKPVGLVTQCLANSTRPGDLILEPFAGSGSTLLAAELLGRRCAAIEIDPRYVAVTLERWQAFTGRKAVLRG